MGLSRQEIMQATGQASGGRLTQRLQELEASGFIGRVQYLNRVLRDPTYRLLDEYILFYLKWIRSAPKGIFAAGEQSYWQSRRNSAAYSAWSGNAFEALCLKHAGPIRRALGIEAVSGPVGSFRHLSRPGQRLESRVQIDLLFDRDDGVVQLCEIKYSDEPFVVGKAYARELARKLSVFETVTGTRKQLLLTLITPHGLKRNIWSEDLIDSVVTADDLLAF